MTKTMPAAPSLHGVTIRAYRPADHNACRGLWAELIEHQANLFRETPAIDGDAGAGFEEYLTQLNLTGMWVADQADLGVAGFAGLILDGRAGEVDPVVVSSAMRGRGIGRALLATVVTEARRRGLRRLTVSPPARDVAALHTLHDVGFATVATVKLAYDLGGPRRGGSAEATLDLYDLRFSV